jgi:predicted ATPase/DNA-binding CsgD family transcriptional regulator
MTGTAPNGVRAGRLPTEVTGFVGRRSELAEVTRLLGGTRLVTLTGVGGTGKTRLAIRVATRLRRGFADGVWMVDLATVGDAAVLVHEVAETLGLRDRTQRPPVQVIVEFLRERQALLVLDNCEHLLDGCAEVVVSVLRGAAGVRVLCTSRQPLGVVGEAVWTVPALACPEPEQPVPPGAEVSYPALALFVQRAGAVSPGFALTADTAPTVVEICHRLDGLPLAIELAASQLRVLSLDQLAAVLRAGFPTLGVRGAWPAWHGTLEAAFDWSYRLCTPAERLAWMRASVFAGSFGLAAAEDVCAGEGLPAGQVLDALAGLVDKSVLIREEHPTGVRYRLLATATVREYGLARLRAEAGPGVEPALRRRHRDWYLDLTARFDAEWFGATQLAWGQRLEAELPDLRAALDYCLNTEGQTQAGLTLAANLAYFWNASGRLREGSFWYRRVLAADPRGTKSRLRALSQHCLNLNTFANAEAIVLARECIELARQLGDADAEARATRLLAGGLYLSGNPNEARPLAESAFAHFVTQGTADLDLAMATLVLAVTLLQQGDLARAAQLLADCQATCRRHGDQWYLGHVLNASALVALAVGDVARATGYVREGLPARLARGDIFGIAASIDRLAWTAAVSGDFERAARLLGAANQQWHLIDPTLHGAPQWLAGRHECEALTRTGLGDQAYERVVQHGAGLTVDQAVAYALGEPEPVSGTGEGRAGGTKAGPDPVSPTPHTPLTPREREVTELIAQGLSNRQIASRLFVSQRTAESHVENVLRKLGFANRSQIATWAATHHHEER